MGSELQISHIVEIAEAMGDAPFGSNLKNSHYTESGALVVQGKNVQGRSFDWSDKRHVSLEKWESLPRSQCKPGDLIFPKVGTIGKVGILNECEGYENYILSTNTMRLRVDQTKADPQFVYYFFTAPTTVNLIHALNSKSVQPVFNFTTLKAFQIELPPLPEQKAIAHILGTLDDKIELNRRMNATLEGLAQALFKSWFVDFDPVIDNALAAGNPIPDELAPRAEVRKNALANGATQQGSVDHPTLSDPKSLFPAALEFSDDLGPIPKGWNTRKLSELATVTKGKSYKSSELQSSTTALVTLKSFNRGGGYRLDGLKEYTGKYKPEQVVESGDLIISYTDVTQAADVIGKPAMVIPDERYETLVISLDVGVVRPNGPTLKHFLYQLARTKRFGAPSSLLDGELPKFQPCVIHVSDSAGPMHHS